MKNWEQFNESLGSEDKRNSWNISITKESNGEEGFNKVRNRMNIKVGESIELKVEDDPRQYVHPIYDSQVTPQDGTYTLMKVPLSEIDVVFKGIAKREWFDWDNGDNWQYEHIDDIRENFYDTPPVTLEKKDDKYYSVDGHHRATAALELGLTSILAFVIKVDKLSPEIYGRID